MRRPITAGLLAALLAAGAFTPQPAQAAPVTNKLAIVHLGDSYSAGNGAGSYFGPPDCQRSRVNWGQNFANWVNSTGISATYENRACSGGVVANILNPRQLPKQSTKSLNASSVADARAKLEAADACGARSSDDVLSVEYNITKNNSAWPWAKDYNYQCQLTLRPQADFVGPQTDLVIMTMGGNDVGFATIVERCFAPTIPFVSPGSNAVACRAALAEARRVLPATMSRLKDTIATLLRDKLTGNPNSQVVLLSYPLLATDAEYRLRNDGVSIDAAREVRALGTEALALQQGIVDQLNAAYPGRVRFVPDALTAFAGHEPNPQLGRGNPQRWINEFTETEGDYGSDGKVRAQYSLTASNFWHPNRIGHRELARLLQHAGVTSAAPRLSAAADLDVVFAVDAGSTADPAALQAAVEQLEAQPGSARYALVTYQSTEPSAQVELDFTSDAAAAQAAIDAAPLGSPAAGSSPTELDLAWRPEARKTVVVLGEADQLPATLTEGTGDAAPEVVEAAPELLADAVASLQAQPFAWLQGPYVAQVGSELTLDARGSNAPGSSITKFEWDFDGDGTYEATTDTGLVTHSYATQIEGTLAVRVTDANGQQAVGTTALAITRDGDIIPDDFDNCLDVANPTQQDLDLDGVGDDCQKADHFTVTASAEPTGSTSAGPTPPVLGDQASAPARRPGLPQTGR